MKLNEDTLDEGRTAGEATEGIGIEGRSGGSRRIGDGTIGEGSTIRVNIAIAVVNLIVDPDTVDRGALGRVEAFTDVATS